MKTLPILSYKQIVGHLKIDDDIYEILKKRVIRLDRKGYPYYGTSKYTGDKKRPKTIHVYIHRLVMNFPDIHVDHIDGDKFNALRSNLRACTRSENMQNRRGPTIRNKLGIRGVSWCPNMKKYRAYVSQNKKWHYLGYHDTIEKATNVVQAKRLALGMLS